MNDDQLLLASAYIDDDVDDAARARAEADPEVMAEIDRLRAVRAALRDVGEPDPSRREQALAAALATFGDEPPVPVAPPAVVPLPQRQRRGWWGALGAAAALVLVIAAGTVVLRDGGGQDGDDSAASATVAPAEARQEATMAAPDASSSADAALPAPQAGEAESDSGGAPAATEGASDATSAAGSDTQLAVSLPVLTTPAELAAFATAAADEDASAPRAPRDAATCTHPGTFVGPARYGDDVVEVFDDSGHVSAVSVTTCTVVAEVER